MISTDQVLSAELGTVKGTDKKKIPNSSSCEIAHYAAHYFLWNYLSQYLTMYIYAVQSKGSFTLFNR